MSILYVTRNLNHSGYFILERLIKDKVPIIGLVIPKKYSLFDYQITSKIAKLLYFVSCKYQGAENCKTVNSERLLAMKSNIPVYRIKSMNSEKFKELLIKKKPEIIFLGGGWPELIPLWVIDKFHNRIFNTHPSLLPKFRGTSIHRWQILKNAEYSGITVHRIDKSFDTGNIIVQKVYKISKDETPQTLFKSLGEIGSEMVSNLFKKTRNLTDFSLINEINQYSIDIVNNYYSKWNWEWNSLKINIYSNSLENIDRFIRANNQESYFYIGPHLKINNKLFIVRKSEIKLLNKEINKISLKEIDANHPDLANCILSKKGIEIISKDKSISLLIKSIQKFDCFFYLRRSKNPSMFFKENSTVKLELSNKF